MRILRVLPFVLLAACGQSGDLYLPAEQPEPQAAPSAPAPAEQPPTDEKKDKK